MAFIDIIAPNNLAAFDPMIPDILKAEFIGERDLRFYGISEEGTAAGVVIIKEIAESVEIRYMYLVPVYRGLGMLDQMLMQLFMDLKEEGFTKAVVNYLPSQFASFKAISDRFGFREIIGGETYLRFKADAIKKCPVSTYEPRGIMRVMYLPKDKQERLFKMIDKSFSFPGARSVKDKDYLTYSMAYLENGEPKGALIVQNPRMDYLSATDDKDKFPEPGAYDLLLFFVGTLSLKAPLYLMSGLCRLLQNELPDDAVMTGYFPEAHVAKLLENALGVTGEHRICATLDFDDL